jgi:TM2 domain-containing membrane protein YozV
MSIFAFNQKLTDTNDIQQMNNAIRAVLLSGLVLPGLGQVVLKRYARGIFLMGMTLIFTGVIVVKAVQQALRVLNQIPLDGSPIDMGDIYRAVSQASTASDSRLMYLSLFLLIFCWIYGVVDGYLLGKKMDQIEKADH